MSRAPGAGPWRSEVPAGWRPEAVYAIRYATRPSAVRGEHFYGHEPHPDAPMPIDYYVWLVTGPSAALLVDAGFTPETAQERPGRQHLGSPLEVATALGYPPELIAGVVVSHCHYDHTGYLTQLPTTRVHLQERELAFWTGRHAHREMYRSIAHHGDVGALVQRNFDGLLDQYEGAALIAPGVTAHLVGGHTPGMQVVRVEHPSGPVVLASDAAHFAENLDAQRPFSIASTVPEMFEAFDALQHLASSAGTPGTVVPGHDPAVRTQFPPALTDDPAFSGRVWKLA